MADVHGGFSGHDAVEPRVHIRFGDGVECGGGFVQHDKGRGWIARFRLVERAGQGDFLRFAAGDFHAARVVIAVERGIQPPGHGGKPLAKARAQQRAFRRGTVVFHARAHILPQREGEQPEILEYHGEERLIFLIAVFADVDAVERDYALGGVVQAAEQLDHGGFAAAIPAHHGHALAHAQREVQILQRVVLRAGIAEGYVVKGDLEFIVEALFHG